MVKFRYHVEFRRRADPHKTYRMTVTAQNADEARAYVRIRVSDFIATVKSPRRGAEVREWVQDLGTHVLVADEAE